MSSMLYEVSPYEMLAARERRADAQARLLAEYRTTLISYTLNIPGPVKTSPLIERGFQVGLSHLRSELDSLKLPVIRQEEIAERTGCECILVVDAPALEIKKLCAAIEDEHPLGRLFDMDVLQPDGTKLDRSAVGGGPRNCIVCGKPGRACAARRLHSVKELQAAVRQRLESYFAKADRAKISELALRAVLDEVCTTPKPGLVDRSNSGSHRDMDFFTFTASASALAPYWSKCVEIGQETRRLPPEETFRKLRPAGRQAERDMLRATGGRNTHKGMIFSLGTVCAAAGRLWAPEGPDRQPEHLLRQCAAMCRDAVERDFHSISFAGRRDTVGARLYLDYGLRGIRGEVANGLPSVLQIGLPSLEAALDAGFGRNDAGVLALLHLLAGVTDTNMISRGGIAAARAASAQAAELLRHGAASALAEAARFDQDFIAQNLSPGGCADLLAITYFLHDWELSHL